LENASNYKTNLIAEIQYFGSIDWIKMLFQFSNIKIDISVRYQKGGFLNKCRLADSNGPVLLSVPLVNGRSQQGPVKDIRISYAEPWQIRHRRTIESCYANAPFYEYYRDGLMQLLETKHVFLVDLNQACLDWLLKRLQHKGRIEYIMEWQERWGPDTTDLRGIRNPPSVHPPIHYTQVFEDRLGFLAGLCILDMLCCCGPQTTVLLKQPTDLS
jgi:hypothetical protein